MGFIRRTWFQIFISGLLLLYVVEKAVITTNNPNFIPSVILLGSFLVPVSFITYLYGNLPNWEYSLPPMAICFLWGGVVGTVVAGNLEYDVVKALGFLPMLGVGLIEESAKLIFPLAYYLQGRHRSLATGILLGTASGMGFAALETMGYSFVSLLESKGNLVVLDEVLLARGLLSPAGHAAWTGLVCAVLWRERAKTGHTVFNWQVVKAFLTAVLLHALWDIFNSTRKATFLEFIILELLSLLVAYTSISLLNKRVREAQLPA
ncbi:FHA domain containing protein (plasmid) [Scytonema sp. HK-05]|uniref:PrsW family intramembrane metalloprotease n=1 Tax=Scytonema sp. HK-05 TaxID=1137095 RepID=UPI0009373A9B|nr:PrsW family intramembrane metalloprotease [Scytonema sp. HK-05]OKH43029.1 protease PrsW [Scytonema sp. HK-05]BAY50232.1 FHA domain containing protein [Scytonema sp. HK-05]